MTVESNYVIAISTLSDWLKRLAPVFPSTNEKQNQNQSRHDISRASGALQVIARNCSWFMELFVPVVIGRNNCFRFSFSTVI